jgi:hypothetical protein
MTHVDLADRDVGATNLFGSGELVALLAAPVITCCVVDFVELPAWAR